jgi:histidinol-phosphate aminotransferase
MTRTFSKVYGLASLRLGWAYCPDEIADVLNRIRGTFNFSGPAIAAGVASIEDDDFMRKSTAHNAEWLGNLSAALRDMGIEVTPSVANFLLLHFPPEGEKTAARADAFLLQKGIVVRRLENYKLPNALRVTIGSQEANEKLIDTLSKFMSGETSS